MSASTLRSFLGFGDGRRPKTAGQDEQQVPQQPGQRANLVSLPYEIHRMIIPQLQYPDLLSLKLCHPYFEALLVDDLTVRSRVEWIVSRARTNLPTPKSTKLSFKSDASFVANPEVKEILRRRRLHLECLDYHRSDCLAYHHARSGLPRIPPGSMICLASGSICPSAKTLDARWRVGRPQALLNAFAFQSTPYVDAWGRRREPLWGLLGSSVPTNLRV